MLFSWTGDIMLYFRLVYVETRAQSPPIFTSSAIRGYDQILALSVYLLYGAGRLMLPAPKE